MPLGRKFETTEDRLNAAKCHEHKDSGYDHRCGACICLYFWNLIDGDYMPQYQFDQLKAQKSYAEAMARSYQVEAEGLRKEVQELRQTIEELEQERADHFEEEHP